MQLAALALRIAVTEWHFFGLAKWDSVSTLVQSGAIEQLNDGVDG
ncbi:hypothetical protein [Vandammella animalimorsus]|nr:hypothetical protein [Vandammella animalimorsus]